MTNNTSDQDPTLDTITRITPTMRAASTRNHLRRTGVMCADAMPFRRPARGSAIGPLMTHLAGPEVSALTGRRDDRIMRTVVAKVARRIPARQPLRLAIGDRVEVGQRDTEWPEFVFVTAEHGSGWVPARHLSASSGTAVLTTSYDTTELPTHVGDLLEVLAEDDASGWLWCRSGDSREGWVPINTLEAGGP
jgi:hypothetical protein